MSWYFFGGFSAKAIVPSARATMMTMNRDGIREVAAVELGLRTSRYRYAETLDEVRAGAAHTGLPCVIKPVMSSSGKGQSTVREEGALEAAWDYAVANMRGDRARVIAEQFIASVRAAGSVGRKAPNFSAR